MPVCRWRSEDDFWELVLSFHQVGSETELQFYGLAASVFAFWAVRFTSLGNSLFFTLVLLTHCFGSVVKQHIIGGSCSKAKPVNLVARRMKGEGDAVPQSPLRPYSQWPKDPHGTLPLKRFTIPHIALLWNQALISGASRRHSRSNFLIKSPLTGPQASHKRKGIMHCQGVMGTKTKCLNISNFSGSLLIWTAKNQFRGV